MFIEQLEQFLTAWMQLVPMETYRWFWALLTIAALAWYSSITVYVAYRGAIDIKEMLKKLSSGEFDPTGAGE